MLRAFQTDFLHTPLKTADFSVAIVQQFQEKDWGVLRYELLL